MEIANITKKGMCLIMNNVARGYFDCLVTTRISEYPNKVFYKELFKHLWDIPWVNIIERVTGDPDRHLKGRNYSFEIMDMRKKYNDIFCQLPPELFLNLVGETRILELFIVMVERHNSSNQDKITFNDLIADSALSLFTDNFYSHHRGSYLDMVENQVYLFLTEPNNERLW